VTPWAADELILGGPASAVGISAVSTATVKREHARLVKERAADQQCFD
jgi:hypothetical protein